MNHTKSLTDRLDNSQYLPVKWVDELVVNISNSYRTATKKSEKKGVKDIRRLVKSSDQEEAWVYLPQEETWFGIGEHYFEKENELVSTKAIKFDTKFIEELMGRHHELIVYHFHPAHKASVVDEIKRIALTDTPMTREEISELRKEYFIFNALPGATDIFNMILFSKISYDSKSDGKITFKICSECGVTEFYLDRNGKKYYKKKNNSEIEIEARALEELVVLLMPALLKQKSRITAIRKACQIFSYKPIKVAFVPYKRLK